MENTIQLSSSLEVSTIAARPSYSYPPTLKRKKSTFSKYDYFYEITHIPESNQVEDSHLPFLNPYKAFRRSSSFSSFVKKLVSPKFQVPKEYILSTKFDQCILPSGPQEHFVTIEIPPEFPSQWIQQGYTHIHFGAVRLALNYHDIKGCPVFSRIALLDSRYLKYENACIGIVETTMDSGTVYMIFLNYNMALKDPTLFSCLKV